MKTSVLQPSQTEVVGTLGTYYFQLVSKVSWEHSCGTELLTCGV